MKKVLILGAAGCVGYAAAQEFLKDKEFKVYGTYHKNTIDLDGITSVKMDINDVQDSINKIEEIAPDIIITCVIQRDFNKQYSFNESLADYAKKTGCYVYFCSTGNAISEKMSGPYFEDCEVLPDCEYGEYKARCEKMFQEKIPERICIIRLPQIWGKRSKHFTRLIEAAKNGTMIDLYPNIMFNVNSDEMLAKQIKFISGKSYTGIIHLAATDAISYETFMLELLKRCGYEKPNYTEHPEEAGSIVLFSKMADKFPKELHITNEEVIEYTLGAGEKR